MPNRGQEQLWVVKWVATYSRHFIKREKKAKPVVSDSCIIYILNTHGVLGQTLARDSIHQEQYAVGKIYFF